MSDSDDFRLRPMVTFDDETLFEWRDLKDDTRLIFGDADVTEEQHASWFQRVMKDDSTDYRMFEHQGEAIGVAHAIDIDPVDSSCFWALYIAIKESPKESLGVLAKKMRDYIFDKHPVERIYGEAYEHDDKMIAVYEDLGFERMPDLYHVELKRGQPVNVLVMALDKAD